jgi:diguanylate cyclase (GGDEF)-like protein
VAHVKPACGRILQTMKMNQPPHASQRISLFRRLSFLKESIWLIAVWPAVSLALGSLLWSAVHLRLNEDRVAIEQNASKETRALAHAYSQYLARAIEQIDQLSMLVKYQWEQAPQPVTIEDLVQQGALPVAQYAVFAVINTAGVPVTGNRPLGEKPPVVTDREYFAYHRDHSSPELLIGKPTVERLSGKTVIQFTRRLERADGRFDGIVLVSVDPSYFGFFYDGSGLGQTGVLAVVGKDGVVRATHTGGGNAAQNSITLRDVPRMDTMNGALFDRRWFSDLRERYVAAEQMTQYPLLAIVGLSREERLASHLRTAEHYRSMALASSFFLMLFALVATLLSVRLAWRKHRDTEVQEAYRIATEGGNEGFYMLRALRDRNNRVIDFEVVDCNERGAALYGVTRVEFVGARSSMLNPPAYFRVLLQTYCKAIESGFYEDEFHVPHESPLRVEWVQRRLVRSGTGLAITVRDISQIKAHERELSRLANEDALTALPNRHWLQNYLPGALQQAQRTDSMMALLFVDLDNFKNVNDTLGHSAGDELLHAAALRLKAMVRPTDHVVRLGGDEFTVVLEPVADEDDAAAVAARIADAFHHPFELSRGKHLVGASIGISLFPRDGGDAETLLKNSDIAMYRAKTDGKGGYRFYDRSLSEILKNRLDTERALQQALVQNQFELHYQPRIDAQTGELRAVEALVRWRHPERGLISPAEFIPLAEETGLILRLGELVLEMACAQMARWRQEKLPLVPVSINVSPYQFNHGDIRGTFSQCLERHQLESHLVEIEITESSMIGDHVEVANELEGLRALGIKLLVDDFGTGYSSLSQLQRLDMDVLKVDRAFTAALCKSSEGEVFIHAIVSMAHALGMTVVAEGVETLEQLQVLQDLACDEVQGYLIARPMPAADLPALLHRRYLLPLSRKDAA